ncbi:MAG TPA: glycosyltransferase, partial [Kofleriaceae bacterium]|nr:glycosyltransferase [Kofleriaceae bacterium]
ARDRRVVVLRRAVNRGIEASVRALYAQARHAWVFLNSADRQWPMSCLELMAAEVGGGADLVVGIRTGKRRLYSAYRFALSMVFEAAVRALGSPVGDPGSIKLGRTALLSAPVAAHGVFAEGERLIRAARAGAAVRACPVPFQRRGAGRARGARARVTATAALDLLRVGASLRLGWPAPAPPPADDAVELTAGR